MARKPLDAAVTDLSHSIGLLVRRVRSTGTSDAISWTESAVLKRLARDGPATTADLARTQGMRTQSMRSVLASLEKLYMIKRKAHATDGRQVLIHLTSKGAAEQQSNREARQNWFTQAVSQLDEADRETIFRAGKIFKRLAKSEPQP